METHDSSLRLLPQWQWRCLLDQTTSQETEWQPYDIEKNYLIERAYFHQQKEITLEEDNNVISFEKMRQLDGQRQIEIRRAVEHPDSQEEEMLRSHREERFAITEIPKTFNNPFGSIIDFLNFFEKRGPEMRTFAGTFREIEESNDFDKLNNIILPALISSIQKESDPDDQGKVQQLTNLFKGELTSFKEFYGQIFKAYTVDGFLYKNLNKYLRNEDWTSLDNLLPYAFCLCKGFLCSDIVTFCNTQKGQDEELILYRGAALDKPSLKLYNPNLTENFSWNSVTSTSTSHRVATNFMLANAEKELSKVPVMFIITIPAATPTPQTSPNFLRIKPFSAFPMEEEIILPPGSIFHIENMHINKHERAVIKLTLIPDVERLAHKGQIMHGAMQAEMMTGTEAKIMCLENNDLKEALVSLAGNQLIKEIEFCLCKFNFQKIRTIIETLPTIKNLNKLTFISCSAEIPDQMGSLFKHLQTLTIQTLHITEINFLDQIHHAFQYGITHWSSLRSLALNFTQSKVLSREWLSQFCLQGLQHLKDLTLLNLDFTYCQQIKDEELSILASDALGHLTQLASLTLNFDQCREISSQGISSLALALRNLKLLTHLDLNLSLSDQIEDQGILSFCSEGLQHCKELTSLTLNLSWLSNLIDEAINSLCTQGLQYLPNLTHFSLDLTCCSSLTETSVSSLTQNGFKFLPKLSSLTLSLKDRRDLTDTVLSIFTAEGLKNLTSLTYLDLNFSACGEITSEGISCFARDGLRNLPALTSLKLSFAECAQFRNEYIDLLCSEGLQYLTTLTTLGLNFFGCFALGDQGLNNLCCSGLKHLPFLISLDLNFALCQTITDEGIHILCTEGLRSLPLLKSVCLNFQWCSEISRIGAYQLQGLSQNYQTNIALFEPHSGHDPSKLFVYKRSSPEDVHQEVGHNDTQHKLHHLWKQISQCTDDSLHAALNLQIKESFGSLTSLTIDVVWGHGLTDDQLLPMFSHGLQPLKQLTSLHLNLANCREMTDRSFRNLASQGLQNLDKLTSLTLIFGTYVFLTDLGISYLCQEGLQYLTQLTSLRLSLTTSWQLTDQAMTEIASNCLQHLTLLTSLDLCFQNLRKLTPQGIFDLCSQGLRFLPNLTSLMLNFDLYPTANDECLNRIATQALCHLPLLDNLNLNFGFCNEISDHGLSQLSSQGLCSLTKLTSFCLNLNNCTIITPAAVSNLILRGLQHLPNLLSFDLDLTFCQNMNEEVLIFLGKNGLKYLGCSINSYLFQTLQ